MDLMNTKKNMKLMNFMKISQVKILNHNHN